MITPIMPTYGEYGPAFERGQGVYLYAADGRRFLDFSSGIAVNGLGHCHPHLVAALNAQGEALWHTSNLFAIPNQQRLAERLVAHSFADTMLFSNSGAEAMECGFKMIRRYHDSVGSAERYRIIAFEGAFHGRTLAAIAAGGKEKHLEGFAPNTDGFDHVAFGNLNELRNAIGPETAAILVEPVQGEGGIHPASMDYLNGLRSMADEFGLLLFLDEIQCGMGRTGRLFAHEWAGIAPDIMMVAKGIGGGFPLGAVLARETAAAGMNVGSHGSTFGGNPLACAVGLAATNIIADQTFLDDVNRKAGLLRQKLESLVASHPEVFDSVHGAGLMLGLKCKALNTDVVTAGHGERVLTVPAANNVIRLLPPLNITDADIASGIARLDAAATQLENAPP